MLESNLRAVNNDLKTLVADAQASMVARGQEMAASADGYVKENPWRMIAAAAGVGLLSGVILGRK